MPLIFLAGVGGPNDPTIARGTITSLLQQLELAEKAQEAEKKHVTCRRDAPTFRHIFRDVYFEIFQFYLFVSSFSFFLRFHFRVTVPVITGRLEQHALAPKFRGEVASRL
jgi:hypothetical protein